MSTREARRRAEKKYQAVNTKLLQIRLNFRTDQDILDKLSEEESMSGYVKRLIRDDIKEGHDDKQ